MISAVSQNWPNWVALLSIILLGSRATKSVLERWYRSMRTDQERAHVVAERMVDVVERFSKTIPENQTIILETVKSTGRTGNEYMLNAIREMSTASNESTGRVLLALGRREEQTVLAIEALARAIRDDLATLRTPPPIGDVGSQVRGSGGAAP
jgi:hypothetical protein